MTPRQHDVLVFVIGHMAGHGGLSPTYREIARGLGGSSASQTHGLVKALCRDGYLAIDGAGRSHNIRVVRGPPDYLLFDLNDPKLGPIDRAELKRIHARMEESLCPGQ